MSGKTKRVAGSILFPVTLFVWLNLPFSEICPEKQFNLFEKVYPVFTCYIVKVLRIYEVADLLVLAHALAYVAQGVLPQNYIV
jgi:hypothetical protein